MTIFLIRHTTPKNAKGLCYGFSDIDVDDNFLVEAEIIKNKLPTTNNVVFSSPLKRCKKLANYLFEEKEIIELDNLKELNFGDWENVLWNDIAYPESKYWMDDFVYQKPPNGESYFELFTRATTLFNTHLTQHKLGFTWVTHSGVLRSILCFINKGQLKDSFNNFTIPYGAIVKIELIEGRFSYEIL